MLVVATLEDGMILQSSRKFEVLVLLYLGFVKICIIKHELVISKMPHGNKKGSTQPTLPPRPFATDSKRQGSWVIQSLVKHNAQI